ncbi:MAG TPA: aminopeptidase N [Acidimicrobiia bacterium]|nr:aminopeptidase N [Acidimicrobiia bacterium]
MAENNLLRSEAADRARLLDDLHYDVTLDLTGEETFRSETRLRCRSTGSGAETFLDLTAVRVVSATVNGAPVAADAFDPGAGRLRIGGLAAENEIVVVAEHAYEHTGVGLHRFVDPVDGAVYLHTQFEPFDAHRVFPCFDQPDLKATFCFEVEAPAGWEVVSNGAVTARPADGGAGRWRFAPTEKMSTYITALVAGPYHCVQRRHFPGGSGASPDERSIDLGLHCRQSMAQYLDADEIFDVTAAGFDFFEEAFGQPYAFGKYDQLFVPEFNFGAMENAGCVTFSERHIFRSKVTEAEREGRADTILHEMAHMWFGDLVTMRWWDDLWLNESFATYASYLGLVEATRFRSAWTSFASAWKTWAYRQDQLPSTHPIVADAPDIETMKTNFDGITYAKGASVLRQLVAWVGQKEFLDGVRAYFARHAWGNTDLADFLAALEEASGRPLGDWSRQWLETTGVNTMRAAFDIADAGGGPTFSTFAIEQEAAPDHPTLRSHRVAVGLYDYDGSRRLRRRTRVELDVEGHRTAVGELAGVAVPDLVLLNDGDLAYTKIRLDARSLATVTESLGTLDDSLARGLCWSAAWDMLRDAELPARRYLDLVLANLAGEDQIAVVAGLLRNAEAAAVVYGDPANREPARRRLAQHALEGLRAAPAGSDVQLAYARAFATAARGDDHLALVRALLDGRPVDGVGGLAVDTELRWALVRSLAAAGVDDAPALIAAEEERDATDVGARHAAAARAAQPRETPKAEAWTALVDGDLPLATMRAVMGGFRQPDQEPLLQAWTARYFDALLRLWERRGPDVGMSFTEMLYPVGDGAVTMTDAYLTRADPIPAPIRRLLLEGRDAALRAARARACDAGAA